MVNNKLFRKQEKKEILYNLINSALAGLLVLVGAFSTGNITKQGFIFAIMASLAVCITKFKEYWDGEKKEYMNNIANFV